MFQLLAGVLYSPQVKAAADSAQAIFAQEEEEEQHEDERECGHEHKEGADGAACAAGAGGARASATMSSQRKGKKIFALSAEVAEEKRGGRARCRSKAARMWRRRPSRDRAGR